MWKLQKSDYWSTGAIMSSEELITTEVFYFFKINVTETNSTQLFSKRKLLKKLKLTANLDNWINC